jgi:ubiquinone/menaquinone biosynthesis C-methylase UbiE
MFIQSLMDKPLSFDRVADKYDETRGLPPEVMTQVIDKLVEMLGRHGCVSVLDAGIGTGRFAAPLKQRGFEIVGADVSRGMLTQASAKSIDGLVRADLRAMPFKDGSFDASMCTHVLHLIRDWRSVLTEIRRVTRKVFVSVVSIYPEKELSLSARYEQMLLESGWKDIHPGLSERDLPEVIPFIEREHAAHYEWTRPADAQIARLENREFSSLWDVPEDLHGRLISSLRMEYSGMQLTNSSEIYIYIWDAKKL